MRPVYMLKLNRSSDSPHISYYAQGISAQCISLSNITHWSIEKIFFLRGKPVSFSLNRHFIAAQRLIKSYCQFFRRIRSLRVLRERELTGKIPLWRAPLKGALYTEAPLKGALYKEAPPIGTVYVVGTSDT